MPVGGGIGDDGPGPPDGASPASSSSSSSEEDDDDDDDDDASGQSDPPAGVHDPAASSYLVPPPQIVTLPIASPEFPPPFNFFYFRGREGAGYRFSSGRNGEGVDGGRAEREGMCCRDVYIFIISFSLFFWGK